MPAPNEERDEFKFPDEIADKEKDKKEAASEEVGFEVIDDTPERDRNRPAPRTVEDPSEEELAEYSARVKSRIDELTRARHDERVNRERVEREQQEALRYAQRVVEENKQLRASLERNNTEFQSTTKTLAEQEIAAAKTKLKSAHEAFDVEAIAEAQAALTAAQIKLDRVNSQPRKNLQAENNSGYTDDTRSGQPAHPQSGRVPDARTAAWMSKNAGWFKQDDEMTALAMGVHSRLVKQGVSPGSDEYFEKIDSRMREVFPTRFEQSSNEDNTPRKQSTVVAPASRATSGTKVRLTQTQVNLAKRLGVPLETYAKHVAALEQKNG